MPASRCALPLLLVLVVASGCGNDTADDPGRTPSDLRDVEAITPAGVAGVVRKVVGADRIVFYSAAGDDDSVGVQVKLAGRQVLVVTVQTAGDVPVDSCDDISDTAMGGGECETSEDGTILASGTAEAFSDDNTRGSTVLAQSVNPDTGRVVYALYETYSPTPGLDPATVAAIVSDPALAAMTDPATNDAGADIEMTGPDA
ncbi:MAG: hypothetical protein JWN68_1188 [Nocardioides sp.]|jgi:hypothetical protein|uniref:hypothetical protein n=1 Tax=Nocardioides sp. TaxID=35761 RepID=UPI0026264565|nr:hypothetical protein [Nocardioides sp.]MCW2833235.1 hypothetical protein [Nocardioides sp.]